MNSFIKSLYFYLKDITGYNKLALITKKPSITILTYHSVLPEKHDLSGYEYRNCVSTQSFVTQLRLLDDHFKVISMEEAVQRLRSGDLTSNYAVITFDDGYQSLFKYALPILKKFKFPASFFITTGLVNTKQTLWTDWITHYFLHCQQQNFTIRIGEKEINFRLKSYRERLKAIQYLKKVLKSSTRKEVERVCETLLSGSSMQPDPIEYDRERYQFMTWEQVNVLKDNGMNIGSHTHSHFLLTMLGCEEVKEELSKSKRFIETNTGRECFSFAYPNGERCDFHEEHIKCLRELKYQVALTQVPGHNKKGLDLYRLRRINISQNMSARVFKAYICGSYQCRYNR